MTTHRVRIALIMTPEGEWDCRGWGYKDGNESDQALWSGLEAGALAEDLERAGRVYWIEADVPVPEAPGVIEGTVEEGRP